MTVTSTKTPTNKLVHQQFGKRFQQLMKKVEQSGRGASHSDPAWSIEANQKHGIYGLSHETALVNNKLISLTWLSRSPKKFQSFRVVYSMDMWKKKVFGAYSHIEGKHGVLLTYWRKVWSSTHILEESMEFWMTHWVIGHFKQRSKEIVQQLLEITDQFITFVDITEIAVHNKRSEK